jgi:eukaryotic-like serine/threonine-protein kinase
MSFLARLKTIFSGNRLKVSARYALLREAISGTMSSFYMARDLKTGQIVGLKILDPQKTKNFEARFKGVKKPTEGEIAIQLKHPRIVETFEHGLTTEGLQYLVMEFIEGPGLNSALVARDPRLKSHRMRYIRQAAESIAAVHRAGFIHRDICPRNFMLTDAGENLKLIDFGLALPALQQFMAPGNRTGTPNYMAPEIIRRRGADQRADVFSFGVTMYELCTLNLPWVRGTDAMAAMAHENPPTDIRQYAPDLPPILAKAIHACIEPDLSKRCRSMEKFLQMIQGVPQA